jgi:hypothetical protein
MNRFIFSITLSLLVLLPVCSFAQTEATGTASSSESIVDTVIENVTEIKDVVVPAPTTPPAEDSVLKPNTQKRIVNLAANISNRFDAVIWRFENIASRLQKRIDSETALSRDTAAAQASLNAANVAIAEAKYSMRDIDVAVFKAVTSKNPKQEWTMVKQRYLNTRDIIKTAYQELKNTIINLKSAGQAPTETSSSTPTT